MQMIDTTEWVHHCDEIRHNLVALVSPEEHWKIADFFIEEMEYSKLEFRTGKVFFENLATW